MRILRAGLMALLLATGSVQAQEQGRCERALVSAKSAVQYVWNLIFGRKKGSAPALPVGWQIPGLPSSGQSQPSGEKGSSAPTSTPQDDYTARNKDTDKPGPEEEAQIAFSFNQRGIIYFSSHTYPVLDPSSGQLSIPPGPVALLLKGTSRTEFLMKVNLAAIPTSGYLHVPFGFRVLSYMGDGLELAQRPFGVHFNNAHGVGEATVFLEPLPERNLSDEERRLFLKTDGAPGLEEYPEKWAKFLGDLIKRRQTDKLSDIAVAEELKDFIKSEMKYAVDQTEDRGVLSLCRGGAVQCDGAALIYVTILRSLFGVASLPVAGSLSSESVAEPDVSVVLDQSTPHMWAAVYDPIARRFVVMDPTPSELTREKENKGKEDPRFREWPQPGNPKPGEEESVRDVFNSAELWARVFADAKAPQWVNSLNLLIHAFEARRAQHGLGPDEENMLRNALYIRQLVESYRAGSVADMAQKVADGRGSGAEAKENFLRLVTLSRLASYGARFAKGQERQYRGLAEVASKLLARLKPAPRLNTRRELMNQLPGPWSREAAENGRASERILRQMARLQEKVRLARLRNYTLQPSVSYRPSWTPTDEGDVEYEIAEDFDGIEHFERGGLPPEYDAIRVVSDDMLIRQWKEPVTSDIYKPDPVVGRELTFILLDLSGSMSRDRKGETRDRLTQMWIDELMAENNESVIEIIGYRDRPETPVTLRNEREAKAQFQAMMVEGEYFKSDDENNTARAFAFAIDRVSKLGGDFRKVNFRLVTDGEETLSMETVRQAKDALGAQVELNLTAVTLVTGNADLKKFIKKNSDANLLNDGTFVHLSSGDIDQIMNYTESAHEKRVNSLIPDNYLDLGKAPASSFKDLTRFIRPGPS